MGHTGFYDVIAHSVSSTKPVASPPQEWKANMVEQTPSLHDARPEDIARGVLLIALSVVGFTTGDYLLINGGIIMLPIASIFHQSTIYKTLIVPNTDLFTPLQLGSLTLPSRIVMAPLTRMRAGDGNVPTQMNADYYAQRASAGLIISEATQISLQGRGYARSPGIHSAKQIAGWQLVTEAVHAAGGRIFLQLWHGGRTSHPDIQEDGALPVAPSAIAAAGHAYTPKGRPDLVTPRALSTEEIPGVVEQFRQGAKNAKQAGFDGVEIHGANGYLIDEFLLDGLKSSERSIRRFYC